MVIKFLVFFTITIFSLGLGYLFRKKGIISKDTSKVFVLIGVLFFESPIVFLVLWKFSISKEFVFLPVLGLIHALLGGVLGYFVSKKNSLPIPKLGAFTFSSALSNQGYTLGGFICYLLLGEYGFGLSIIYLVYFHLLVYLVGYPIANHWRKTKNLSLLTQILSNFKDIRFLPVYTLLLGLFLNITGVPYPEWSGSFVQYMVPPATIIVLFAIGLQIEFSFSYFREKNIYYLFFIKFIVVPLFAILFLNFLSFNTIAKKVVLIQAIMPSAIYSIVISTLFELDSQFAAMLFVTSNLFFLIVVFPFLYFGLSVF